MKKQMATEELVRMTILINDQVQLLKKLIEIMDKDMACMEHEIIINGKALNNHISRSNLHIGRFNDTKKSISKKK